MGKQIYNAIDSKLNTLIGMINNNQNIRRCLSYMGNTPLTNNVQQPDIDISLINNKIILDFFDEQVIEEAGCKLYIYHLNSDLNDSSLSNIYIGIDVV